jgi:YbbR domain-containing protein
MDRLLRNNTVVKIIALLFAVALWFVVDFQTSPAPQFQRATETYRISEVSLTATIDDERLAIREMPKTVTVELKGPTTALNRADISPSEYNVFVDLSNYSKGRHRVPVQTKGFPRELSVRVIPEQVEVLLEEKQKVEKEVTVQFIGKIPEGYKLGEPIVRPKRVHVTLPESQMGEIGQVQASVNVDGVKEPIEDSVALRVFDVNGNPMEAEINPTVVEVLVPVTSPYKVVPIKMSYINHPPEGYGVAGTRLITDKITVYGPLEVIDKMSFYPGPQIDLSSLTEDRYIEMKIPLMPQVVKTEPDYIELEIDIESSTTRTFEDTLITVNGLGDGLNAAFVNPEDGSISLTVRGAVEQVEDLTQGDIELYVDVSNLPPGQHEVPIQMNLPTFITAEDSPESVRAIVRIE